MRFLFFDPQPVASELLLQYGVYFQAANLYRVDSTYFVLSDGR